MDIVADKPAALLISCLFLFNALIFRIVIGSWIAPAIIASFLWFAMTFFPILLLWELPIDPLAILYIFICIFVFSLSSLIFPWQLANRRNELKLSDSYNNAFLLVTFIAIQMVVLLSIPLNLRAQGFSIGDFARSLHGTSGRYLAMKYDGALVSNVYMKAGIFLNYVGVMIAGILVPACHKISKKFFILALAFAPSLLYMVLYADKGTLFLGLFIFYGAFVVGRIRKNDLSLVGSSVLKYGSLSLIVIVPAVVSSFLSRGISSSDTSQIIEKLLFSISSYMLAHLYGFSDWFSSYAGYQSTLLYLPSHAPRGYHTFTSLLNTLGIYYDLPPGYYDEYLIYPGYIQTNIYTIFRGLLSDFGFIGSLVYWFVSGLIFHAALYSLLFFRRPFVSIGIFIFMFGYICTSHLLSLFVWNSVQIASVVIMLLLGLNNLINKRNLRRLGRWNC